MGKPMQPCESHIPYMLAFMADFNLAGCGWLEFANFTTRPSNGRKVVSYSDLEIDIQAGDILNRGQLQEERLHHSLESQHVAGTKIHTLKELITQDNERRQRLNASIYIKPCESEKRGMPTWERAEEFAQLLDQRAQESIENWDGPFSKDAIHSSLELHGAEDLPSAFVSTTAMLSIRNQPQVERTVPLRQASASKRPTSDVDISLSAPIKRSRPLSQEKAMWSLLSFSSDDLSQAAIDASSRLVTLSRPLGSQTVENIKSTFGGDGRYLLNSAMPSRQSVIDTVGIAPYNQPHYSNAADVPLIPFVYAGQEYNLKGSGVTCLPSFSFSDHLSFNPLQVFTEGIAADEGLLASYGAQFGSQGSQWRRFQYSRPLPSRAEVSAWVSKGCAKQKSSSANPFVVPSLGTAEFHDDGMSLLSLEVHVNTRYKKSPVAAEDEVFAVFWQFYSSSPHKRDLPTKGVITSTPVPDQPGSFVYIVDCESDLLKEVCRMTRFYDPDILCGYETSTRSWGYLSARAKSKYAVDLSEELARVASDNTWKPPTADLTVAGRYILNLWSIFRKEVNLLKYTLEHVVYHSLHERMPLYSFDDLTTWWHSGVADQATVLEYYQRRTELNLKLLDHYEIVSRFSVQARIVGIDFLSTLTRGSQFHVEAVLCRLTKRQNFIMASPSRKQVGQQNALEYIPLVMEPLSNLYTDPVCVLDFRSLYPSIVIAFNLCYSTCIGRMEPWRGRNKIGILEDLQHPPGLVGLLKDDIYIAPNGIGYVRSNVRKSLLAKMLEEILDTRFMTKDSMKFNKDDPRYQRNLNNQQQALKFIANVTYGYTSASFSGRMPLAELADSIVLSGREILTRAIEMIESQTKWGIKPKVVYGDTDSLFVKLPNATRSQAFRIGREIAEMVTAANPDPVFLKLEKVYHPCILMTKKRYVGNSYEREDSKAFFDAKGTETIRRDGTPLVQKLERKALEILFETVDLSKVKQYLQNQWRRMLNGQVPIQDYCFAQEVKLGSYKEGANASLPGGAVVSLKKLAKDEGAEPQYRERVPFVVTAGPPGSRITDRCVSPEEMIRNPDLVVDYEYYITKNILPPLERLFNLLGANVKVWYMDMPRTMRVNTTSTNGETVRSYFRNAICPVCLERSDVGVCESCHQRIPRSIYVVQSRLRAQQQTADKLRTVCRLCSGKHGPSSCITLDCPIYYERQRAIAEIGPLAEVTTEALKQLEF